MAIERVAERFGLGGLRAEPAVVAGGLSNELWRVTCDAGVFAVKRMVVNARLPQFAGNVEKAFLVERRAWEEGVAMPEPIVDPETGCALARVEGDLYRVHRWVSGAAGGGTAEQAAELLATIHAAGRRDDGQRRRVDHGGDGQRGNSDGGEEEVGPGWKAERWGPELARLAERVREAPERMLVVDSHGDLDRKNTLLREDGVMVALDWDAAGPVGAAQEAVALALDWAGEDRGVFARAVAIYRRRSGVVVEAEPWVFGGWVAAMGGWLDYNADHRAAEVVGGAEIVKTEARLRLVAADFDAWLEILARA
ncbi:phosphotransferase [Actinoplanes sp. LDG1-06]|uniref:Phosphotransferase n=1 Tax=Paractinoplanes ovalisporus TaxID=2810368 RepID=A0ABS2AAN1_9ACTN|nr:phosphotransferase [Actinoplanes ovalisporus]MBM2616888.1 phosphotransferase [Actinoplanes ovalisporus]